MSATYLDARGLPTVARLARRARDWAMWAGYFKGMNADHWPRRRARRTFTWRYAHAHRVGDVATADMCVQASDGGFSPYVRAEARLRDGVWVAARDTDECAAWAHKLNGGASPYPA